MFQVQGIVVGWLAALLAMAMAWLGDSERADLERMVVITASSVITASAASFILGQEIKSHISVFMYYQLSLQA